MLLADLIDLLQAALPLLIAVGWGLLQVFSAMQGNGDKKKQPAPRPRPAPEEGGDKNAELRSEVDEFLRRLKDPDAAEPERPARPQQQPPKPRREKPRRPRVEVLVDDEPVEDEPRRVARPVERPKQRPQPQRRPPKPAAADQAAGLRERMAKAEARAHEKNDHKLGGLGDQDAATDAIAEAAAHAYDEPAYAEASQANASKQPTAAQQIADMLRDPNNVRNAVVLNEILTRRS